MSTPEPVIRDGRDFGFFPRLLEHIFGPIRREEARAIAGWEDERFRVVAVCVAALAPAFEVRGQLRRHSDLAVSLECRVPSHQARRWASPEHSGRGWPLPL